MGHHLLLITWCNVLFDGVVSVPDLVKYINAEVIRPKSASIMLTWSKPDNPNGDITGYQVTHFQSSFKSNSRKSLRFCCTSLRDWLAISCHFLDK